MINAMLYYLLGACVTALLVFAAARSTGASPQDWPRYRWRGLARSAAVWPVFWLLFVIDGALKVLQARRVRNGRASRLRNALTAEREVRLHQRAAEVAAWRARKRENQLRKIS